MPLRVFLDIETIPPDEREKPDVKPSVARKIFRNRDARSSQAKQKFSASDPNDNENAENENGKELCSDEIFRALALHAEYGRILCIGVLLEKDGKEWRKGVFGYDNQTERFHLDEKKTLRGFWKLLAEEFSVRRDLIIGHNILDFDMRFIQKRSVIHKVEPSVNISFKRYYINEIFDTMWVWSGWQHRITLDDLTETLGLKSPKEEGISGNDVYDLFLEGRHSEIAEYCMRDVQAVREVYHRLEFQHLEDQSGDTLPEAKVA